MKAQAPRTHPIAQPDHEARPVRAFEVELPPAARGLSTLRRIDYSDAFRLETPLAGKRSGEGWACAILEGAPPETRRRLRQGWLERRVQLGPPDDGRFILGWEVRASRADYALLEVSGLSTQAQLLCQRQSRAVLVATFMQLDSPQARLSWDSTAPHHRKILRQLVEEAGQRAAEELA